MLLISSLLAFLFAELVYRRLVPAPPQATASVHQLSNNIRLLYEPIPGASKVFNGVLNQINSGGFRDREYPISKPPRTKRILFLGDSLVYGYGVEAQDTLPKRLEAIYEKHAKPVEVLNFGVSGYDTEQEVEFFEVKGLKYQPDVVLLGYTLNDARYSSWELGELWASKFPVTAAQSSSGSIEEVLVSLLRRSQLLERMSLGFGIHKRVKFLGIQPQLGEYLGQKILENQDQPDSEYVQLEKGIDASAEKLGTSQKALVFLKVGLGLRDTGTPYGSHWNVSYRALDQLRVLSQKHSFHVVVTIFPFIQEMERYPLRPVHDFLRSKFQSLGFETLDLLALCKELCTLHGDQAVSRDGIHFTPLALSRIAEFLYSAISDKEDLIFVLRKD